LQIRTLVAESDVELCRNLILSRRFARVAAQQLMVCLAGVRCIMTTPVLKSGQVAHAMASRSAFWPLESYLSPLPHNDGCRWSTLIFTEEMDLADFWRTIRTYHS
jgi:hypothetical protein